MQKSNIAALLRIAMLALPMEPCVSATWEGSKSEAKELIQAFVTASTYALPYFMFLYPT